MNTNYVETVQKFLEMMCFQLPVAAICFRRLKCKLLSLQSLYSVFVLTDPKQKSGSF